MNIKTLLLGTATAFAAVNGAQAADLAVAEPVDYVKVCDAYGAGYFYIPGTDTCLKIGGYIKGYIDISDNKNYRFTSSDVVSSTSGSTLTYAQSNASDWSWTTETSVNVTAQSMTDIGLLTGWIDYRAKAVNGGHSTYVDSAYLKAGPLKVGYFTNIFMYGGGFGEIAPGSNIDPADNTENQVAFSTSLGGMGLWLGISDNRWRVDSAADYDSSWPDVIAAVTGASGGFDWKLSGAVTDTIYGTGWAAQIGATWTAANGDAIRAKASVANGYGAFYVDNGAVINDDSTYWGALVSGVHYWSSNVSTIATAGYSSRGDQWDLGLETDWLVAKNFLTGISVEYWTPEISTGSWNVELRAVRTF
jgi:hypothetical protein